MVRREYGGCSSRVSRRNLNTAKFSARCIRASPTTQPRSAKTLPATTCRVNPQHLQDHQAGRPSSCIATAPANRIPPSGVLRLSCVAPPVGLANGSMETTAALPFSALRPSIFIWADPSFDMPFPIFRSKTPSLALVDRSSHRMLAIRPIAIALTPTD